MSDKSRAASDDLANHIGNWLSDQIALGARPIDLHDAFVRALGIGVRMFAETSVEQPEKIGEVIGLSAKAIVLSRSRATNAAASLMSELRKLGATDIVISSDVPVRQDGSPYADAARRIIRNPGVAVYFTLKGKQMAMARDKFERVEDNLRSIGLAIEAIRAVERHGGAAMMERAFAGFTALPAPKRWPEILGVPATASAAEIERAFKAAARRAHPDAGGSTALMAELNAARDQALREIGA
jgi:hypothetical protein